MKIFVWHSVSDVSENYHSGGGVVIVDQTLEQAREAFLEYRKMERSGYSWRNYSDTEIPPLLDEPDFIADLRGRDSQYKKSVHVHPDAGCC